MCWVGRGGVDLEVKIFLNMRDFYIPNISTLVRLEFPGPPELNNMGGPPPLASNPLFPQGAHFLETLLECF